MYLHSRLSTHSRLSISQKNFRLITIATIAALIIVLIFISGCLGSSGSVAYREEYKRLFNRTSMQGDIQECRVGECWCMSCRNGTSFFPFFTSMVGGECWFERGCNQARFGQLISGSVPNTFVRGFMIGQGPSISAFGSANPYCTNRLSMAVHWLLGNERRNYTKPDPSRAICLLERSVMPVYVLYSEGKNINAEVSREIGRTLATGGQGVTRGTLTNGPVGAVIVTTEIDYNITQADQIARQIEALYEGCGNVRIGTTQRTNCLIAVAPKMGDTRALDAVLNRPSIKSKVDVVAFGINAHKVATCNPGEILEEARIFASYALYTHGKPTVIPYILFDAAGTSEDGCEWNEYLMRQGYQMFFVNGEVVSLQKRGVIGIAPYTFNNTGPTQIENPLRCLDCDLGKNELRLASWFAGCQAYTNITREYPSGQRYSRPSPGTLIVFPNESGGSCDFNGQLDYVFNRMSFGDSSSGRDFLSPNAPPLQPATETLVRCEACLSNDDRPMPFNFNVAVGGSSSGTSGGIGGTGIGQPGPVVGHVACTTYDAEINFWAGARDIDPVLVRAFIIPESGFKACDIARVCQNGYDENGPDNRYCFDRDAATDDECYGFAFNEMYDPRTEAGTPTVPWNTVGGFPSACPVVNDPQYMSGTIRQPRWRWCAFGLMQVTDPPYTFWPESLYPEVGRAGPHWDVARENFERSAIERGAADGTDDQGLSSIGAMRNIKALCGDHFNPFNVTDNLCWGTAKLQANLRYARQLVQQYHNYDLEGERRDLLNWDPSTDEGRYKDEIFAAYIAGNLYSGFWGGTFASNNNDRCIDRRTGRRLRNGECWIREFYYSWNTSCEFNRDTGLAEGCRDINRPDREAGYGWRDPIEYITEYQLARFAPRGYKRDRGATKLAYYFSLRDQCPNSPCPDWRRLRQRALDEGYNYDPLRVPSSRNIYIRDNPRATTGSGGTGTP